RYDSPQTLPNRETMVHLFEWKWTDVAKECEDFLQHYGYGAVQVSPPNEHVIIIKNNDLPWWVRYQAVSYKLSSRSGNKEQFVAMVERCNKVGVRVIVDVVLNHMTGAGMKKGENGVSSSGDSYFDSTPAQERFPGVPYGPADTNDFRCNHDIARSDYQNNAINVRNCRLVSLIDLNQGSEYVRSKIREYLNTLIDMGVAGFRMDASKHMWPGDLKSILDGVKNLRNDIFGDNQRPFVVHEVIDRGGEAVKLEEYIEIGRYTDFNYGSTIAKAAWREKDFSDLKWWGPGYGYGNLASNDVLAFIDNHDNQRDPHPYVPTYKNGDQYAMCVGFMLAWNYGYPRVISSYYFISSDQGPPNYGPSSNFTTKSPRFAVDKSCLYSSGFVCEHRWQAIRGMARFRQECSSAAINNVTSDRNRLAFARAGKGYFAVNNDYSTWTITVSTTLPEGSYCEVWSGELRSGQCTGKKIDVSRDGMATFNVRVGQFMAIHIGAKI
uniref:Alpha-amylase n=1 Tax=Parascaris univalens TaxID=6257 RepID=A0A914ZYN9_PARUN